jgi:hypothetical protein
MKRCKSPGSDQFLAELIQAGGEILCFKFHKLINSNKDQWKESIIIPVHKDGDKTECSNYRGVSLLSASYKILFNILLSRVRLYIVEIVGDHQYGLQRNRSTTDQIFCIHQTLEKKWEYNETVGFKIAYDSVRREVLYNIFIEFGVLMKLVRLIKMCLNET